MSDQDPIGFKPGEMAPSLTPARLVVISPDGKIEIGGKWKIGELLGAAQALANLANNIEVETQAPAQ